MSRTLQRHEHSIAEAAAAEFLVRHPEWVEHHGEVAGLDDARRHVQFLGAALASGSPEVFRDYVQWAGRVLAAREIPSAVLWEHLRHVESAAGRHLAEPQRHLVSGLLAFAATPGPPPVVEETGGALAVPRRLFVQAILAGERKAALQIALEALRDGATVLDVYAEIFQAALYDVGARWEANRISVAQEHMATSITQYVMAHVFEHIEPPLATRGLALVTGVPGELHHVGAMMVSDMLEAHCWQVQFLGSNLPIPSIVSAVAEARPQLLGISVTMPFNVRHARDLVVQARQAAPGVRVVVGGAAFRTPAAWREAGADDFAADVRSAVALLCGPQ